MRSFSGTSANFSVISIIERRRSNMVKPAGDIIAFLPFLTE
jgi:hypothetical protein